MLAGVFQAQHQELLSQQQDVILATQAAQAFLDKHGHSLPGEERARLQGGLAELKERYAASLARSEAQLKQVQVLRDELQKFLRDHGEFEAWLKQAEQDLEGMCKGDGDPASLRQLLLRQGSFSEDVISHKGDLRFVTMSGQKVLDAEGAAGDAGSSGSVVKSKLEDASQRYATLHSKVWRALQTLGFLGIFCLLSSCVHPLLVSLCCLAVHQARLPPEHPAGSLPAVPGGGRVSPDVAGGQRSCGWEAAIREHFFRSHSSPGAAGQHWGAWGSGHFLGECTCRASALQPQCWTSAARKRFELLLYCCWVQCCTCRLSSHCRLEPRCSGRC